MMDFHSYFIFDVLVCLGFYLSIVYAGLSYINNIHKTVHVSCCDMYKVMYMYKVHVQYKDMYKVHVFKLYIKVANNNKTQICFDTNMDFMLVHSPLAKHSKTL